MIGKYDNLNRRVIRSSVDWSGVGFTLSEYLAGRFTYRTIEEWNLRIDAGEIRLNGMLVDPNCRLELHDQIEYFPTDMVEPEADLHYRIACEDDALLVIDKPGNLCVHPSGPFFKHTLWHLLSSKYGEIHLVNRLDRETSGLLIATKSSSVAAKLNNPSWTIHKEYLAVVFGKFTERIEANGFLVPDHTSKVRKKRRFVLGTCPPDGAIHPESARTLLLPEYHNELFSLVRALPETGRLHQIRATLFSLGFPLVGDKLYGPDEEIFLRIHLNSITPIDRERLVLPRQALHSARLLFRHPNTNAEISVESPLPAEFACLFSKRM